MKKAFFFVCLAILVVGIVFYGNHRKETNKRQALQQQLITAIENKRSGNERVAIDFKQITSFSWDKMYVFTTYTPAEKVNKQLGFTWSYADDIEVSDSFNLIVFTKGNKVVQYLELPRRFCDFDVRDNNVVTPGETVQIK